MKFKAQKLAAKLSSKCQLRCKVYGRTTTQHCTVASPEKKNTTYLFVTELLLVIERKERQ